MPVLTSGYQMRLHVSSFVLYHSFTITLYLLKNNLSIFRAGRVEEFAAAAKCDFLAKLVPAARNNEVKF